MGKIDDVVAKEHAQVLYRTSIRHTPHHKVALEEIPPIHRQYREGRKENLKNNAGICEVRYEIDNWKQSTTSIVENNKLRRKGIRCLRRTIPINS